MGLYQSSADDLAAMISSASGVTVTGSMFTVQAIRPTTTAEQSGAANGKNTKAYVTMNVGAALRGSMSFYYDRLDLGALSNFQPYLVSAPPNVDVSTLLSIFFNEYGFLLTMNDIADATSTIGTNGNTQVILTTLSTSLGYTGTFTVNFAPEPSFSTAFLSNVLTGF